MSRLLDDFEAAWKRLGVPADQPVLLALSGGIDSMVLAALLLEAQIPFAAAHCNFQLRAEASDADEAFVREWAAGAGVVLHCKRIDTRNGAASGESIQMAARRLRYDWFDALRLEYRYAAILTAHHADDLAETLLINLLRGSGLGGMQGIPERNGAILRPLLFAARGDIAAYASSAAVAWREDRSNAETKYLRNAIRHRVMPLLEELQAGAGARIAQTARRIAGSLPVYYKAMNEMTRGLIQTRGRDHYVPLRLLRKQQPLETIVYELFKPFSFSGDQVGPIIRLFDSESGRFLQSETHRLLRDRDFLIVTTLEPRDADLITVPEPEVTIATRAGRLRFSLLPAPAQIPDDPDVALLDARSITFPLTIRTRREGDYFYPLGMGGKKKKLKRYLVDVKMPQPEKERLLVLEQAGKILWIVGSRIDERFCIRPDTVQVLEVRLVRGE